MSFARKRHLVETLDREVAVLQTVSLKVMTDSGAPLKLAWALSLDPPTRSWL